MIQYIACNECGIKLRPHWLKNGVCNGCNNPGLIVEGLTLTKQELVDAKDWLLDCCHDEDESDFIQECTDIEIERLVKKHYSGGLQEFIDSYGPDYKYKREA